jgi:cardiolipin synthase
MFAEAASLNCSWLCTGQEVFPAMLGAIDAAQESVCLEMYIFAAGELGERFRDALLRARQRGASVRVLVDGLGSYGLPENFWNPLKQSGGEVKVFNPLSLPRLGIRNHRKLLVCDKRVAFIGGFNIAKEYEGDGVTCGWCDIGLKLEGPLAGQLASSFDEMFQIAELRHRPFPRLRRTRARRTVFSRHERLLLSGPGLGRSPIQRALRRDLARGKSISIVAAYFLPAWRLRRQLMAAARRGGSVRLILAGQSDVAVAQLAGRSLYRRLLRAGVEIYEYQPQILHAKLVVIDNAVYVGSANFDLRSFHFNYELMIRFEDAEFAARARELFATHLKHSRQITHEEWIKSRSLWQRLKQRWAYFLLARIDPYLARRQWRALAD